MLLLTLLLLKLAASLLCMRSGAPGGLFTPSLTLGALLGGRSWPRLVLALARCSPRIVCGTGAGAMLAATTQGPISTVVLMMELSGRYRSFVLPLLLVVVQQHWLRGPSNLDQSTTPA